MRAPALATLLLCATACAGRYPPAFETAQVLAPVPGLPAPGPECLVANHVHTQVSDRYSHAPTADNAAFAYDPAGLKAAIGALHADGLGAMVVTDHNSTHARFDPAVAAAPLTVIPGMEWTTRRGHALLINFAAAHAGDAVPPPPWRGRIDHGDFRRMVVDTHLRGGLVIIAHPRVPFRTWPNDTFQADGVEVWGLDHAFMRNRQALRWWHERLVRGERLVAVAGTDLHPGAWLRRHRTPLNRIAAPSCGADDVLAGLRAGHVVLVGERDAPGLMLGVEAGGALDFAEGHAGDVVTLHGREFIELQVRVRGGENARLRVLGAAGVHYDDVVRGRDAAVRLRIRVQPGAFVRAELHRGRRLLALANPVYFR